MSNDIYDGMLSKIDNIKLLLTKIKEYNEKNNNIKHLEKINTISTEVNYLTSNIEDLHDMIIENIDDDKLDSHDKYKKKENMIYKKSYETFLPYILQMQIMLKNKL